MRTGFLWSLLNLAGGSIQQHIVLQTPPTVQDHRLLLEQSLSHGVDPHYEKRKLIRFSNDFHQEQGITTVPLRTVYDARDNNFPRYHMYSTSHFTQFSHSMYASVMEYAEFCKMEDKLAHILHEYLGDTKNHWLILMDDPFLMASIRGYGPSHTGRTAWITTEKTTFHDMLLVDLQEDHPHV